MQTLLATVCQGWSLNCAVPPSVSSSATGCKRPVRPQAVVDIVDGNSQCGPVIYMSHGLSKAKPQNAPPIICMSGILLSLSALDGAPSVHEHMRSGSWHAYHQCDG